MKEILAPTKPLSTEDIKEMFDLNEIELEKLLNVFRSGDIPSFEGLIQDYSFQYSTDLRTVTITHRVSEEVCTFNIEPAEEIDQKPERIRSGASGVEEEEEES